MNKELKHRKGRIFITRDLFNIMTLDELKLFHSNFYINYVDNSLVEFDGRYCYYGYSEHFDIFNKQDDCLEIPIYVATINSIEKTISFERQTI